MPADGDHLALGLLTVGEGVAHHVLVNLGVSYELLRRAMTEVIADATPAARGEEPDQSTSGRPAGWRDLTGATERERIRE